MYWRIDTFKIIVLEGLFASIPWSALSFTTMYFQYMGISYIAWALTGCSPIVNDYPYC